MDTPLKPSDELRKVLQDDIKESSEALSNIKALSDSAPLIEERKQEIETLQTTLEKLPDDVAEEIAPRLLALHQESRQKFQSQFPKFIFTAQSPASSLSSSTGTASTYYVEFSPISLTYADEAWAKDLLNPLDELARQKATKTSLQTKLEKLDPGLLPLFSAAIDSYEKSKSGVTGLDHAAIRIRDFLQQVWGALAWQTQQKCAKSIGNLRLSLNKQSHREKVAQCLGSGNYSKDLLLVLDQLSQLYLELSSPAKDPLFNDRRRLEDYFTRFILQVDAIFTWLD